MNKADLISEVAEKTGEAKTKVAEIVDATFDAMTEAVKQRTEIRIPNFGVFRVKATAARKARNPQTGEEVIVPAREALRFQPGKALKEMLEAPAPASANKR